jgi:uncharacterized glyoxalase superfamily protein PhnB
MYKNITANLMVENVDETAEFYCRALGFSILASVPKNTEGLQFAILAKDSLSVMIQDRENLIGEYPVLSTPKVQPSVTLYITVDNFAELYDELKGKCDIVCDVHMTFYGANEFAIKDNNGYVLTFAENKH